jgi:hypothetical protein
LKFKKPLADKINRLFKLVGIKYAIVKDTAIYYDYLWVKAQRKIDLKRLPGFAEIASRVIEDQTTFLDYDRLYTLWQAVGGIPATNLPIAEIGTYRGGSAKFILLALEHNGYQNSFYIFDTFEGHVLVDSSIDGKHRVGTFGDISYDKVKAYLDSPNVTIYKGDFLKTAENIKQISNFGLVHLDVDVYPVTKFCLQFFADRTIPGSVIVIDDYGYISCKGALKATDEFVAANPNFKLLHLLTGQALLVKTN